MGLLSFLFRAIRGGGREAPAPASASPATTTPRLLTPNERQALLSNANPEEMKYRDWQSGSSSWIAALRFNPVAGYAQMRVRRGGKIYTFGGMGFTTFRAWITAGSWGRFFNSYLKGRYTQWGGFMSVGAGILATAERARGNSVMRELKIH